MSKRQTWIWILKYEVFFEIINIYYIIPGVQHHDLCVYYEIITIVSQVNNHHHTVTKLFSCEKKKKKNEVFLFIFK